MSTPLNKCAQLKLQAKRIYGPDLKKYKKNKDSSAFIETMDKYINYLKLNNYFEEKKRLEEEEKNASNITTVEEGQILEEKNREDIRINIDDDKVCYEPDCKKCKIHAQIMMEKVDLDVEINDISDLIKLCNQNTLAVNIEYNIDMKALPQIKNELMQLDRMVGMKSLKVNILDQLLYYIQKLHIKRGKGDGGGTGDFLHTVIYGPPGTGKTEVAKIIGKIYSNLGILKKQKFKKVTRADLIAGYLGQTALKTKDVIKESLGGVLFIDEAYALGNQEKRDSFSKECIDTLCEALSDHKDNLMVIIAGYEKELKDCFFNYNEGLDSRFTWRFKIDEYNAEELRSIFEKKVQESGWSLAESLENEWFEKNNKYFKYFGRDMETLFAKTEIAHSKRVFCKPESEKTRLKKIDLEKGFEIFLQNEEVKKRGNEESKMIGSMYL